jgi:hypothetical protein
MIDKPCDKHGDVERDATGRCPQCRNEYQRKLMKRRYDKRKKELKQQRGKEQ